MKRKMKIIIATDEFPPRCSGSGWSTYYLARALRSRGHEIMIATPGKKGKRKYDKFDIHQFGIPIFKEFNHMLLRKGLQELCDRIKPDAVHAQHLISIRAVAGLSGVRKIATVRDYWPSFYDGTMFNFAKKRNYKSRNSYIATLHSIFIKHNLVIKLFSPIIAAYMKFRVSRGLSALRQMDRVICVSNFVRMNTPVKPEKKIVVENMIDLERNERYLNKDFSGKIVFAGKFNHAKGALLAAEVIGSLPYNIYHKAVLIGDGPLKKKMMKVAGPKADFMGTQSNETVLKEMAGSVVLLPAMWDEPLGRTILEALSVGACVISTPTGGTPEIIKDGWNGSLCMANKDVLRAEMLRVLKYDKEYYMNKALESAKRFDHDALISRYESVYSGHSE